MSRHASSVLLAFSSAFPRSRSGRWRLPCSRPDRPERSRVPLRRRAEHHGRGRTRIRRIGLAIIASSAMPAAPAVPSRHRRRTETRHAPPCRLQPARGAQLNTGDTPNSVPIGRAPRLPERSSLSFRSSEPNRPRPDMRAARRLGSSTTTASRPREMPMFRTSRPDPGALRPVPSSARAPFAQTAFFAGLRGVRGACRGGHC